MIVASEPFPVRVPERMAVSNRFVSFVPVLFGAYMSVRAPSVNDPVPVALTCELRAGDHQVISPPEVWSTTPPLAVAKVVTGNPSGPRADPSEMTSSVAGGELQQTLKSPPAVALGISKY